MIMKKLISAAMLCIMFIACAAPVYKETIPWKVNYDEAKMPSFPLPDVMTCTDGTKVTTKEIWLKKRRNELLKMFRDYMYGSPLPLPDKVVSTVISEKKGARNGLAIRREVRLDFFSKNGARHQVIVLLYIPKNSKGKVPVCIGLTFSGNQTITDENDVFMSGLQGKRNHGYMRLILIT